MKKDCVLLLNTRRGYVLAPQKHPSIRSALRAAKESGLAFRIVRDGEVIKRGWYA